MAKLSFPGEKRKDCFLLDGWSGKAARLESQNGVFRVPFVDYGVHWFFFPEGSFQPEAESEWLDTLKTSVSGKAVTQLDNGWNFEGYSAVPGQEKPIRLTGLSAGDWSEHPLLSGFSGRGIYRITFSLQKEQLSPRLALDLGLVGDIAQVTVNGIRLEDRLSLPYAYPVGSLLQEGENQLCIEVTNCLRNGMMGAGLLKSDRQKAMSGLAGPVRLMMPQ